MRTGSCLCGAVSFELTGPLDDIVCCHCSQCRKQTGHYWASTHTADTDLHLISQDGLSWYRSSAQHQRGFCKSCGSNLFWKADHSDVTSVCVGAIDGPTQLSVAGHIFVKDKGDYYAIHDGQFQRDHFE
jgi:hypothetical protein